jgi:hypothetical protein
MARSARALVVELVADVGDFVKGTQKANTALEDFVADTEAGVRDINSAAAKLGDNIKDPFDKVGTSAKDAAGDAETAFENLAREAKRSLDKIDASDIDLNLADEGVKHQAGEAGKEVAGEFAMNLGSSLGSGDTSKVVQDSIGGVIGPLAMAGPIGLAAASGGAIALGLWNAFTQKAEQEKQRALGIIESFFGEADRLTAEHARQQSALDLLGDDAIEQQQELLRLSKLLGISTGDVLRIVQGTHPEQQKMLDKLHKTSTETDIGARNMQRVSDQAKAAKDLIGLAGENTAAWSLAQDTVNSKIQTGVATLEEIQNADPIQLADPKNLQDLMAAINSWNNIDPRKKVTLDIITSQEDQRKLNALGQVGTPGVAGGRTRS